MGRLHGKTLLAALALAVSLVLLTAGTYAWYTISTEADAGDIAIVFGGKYPLEAMTETSGGWQKQIDVGALLALQNADAIKEENQGAAPLRPVSTYDLEHWYVAEYAGDGSVQTFSLEQLDAIANRPRNMATQDKTDLDGNPVYETVVDASGNSESTGVVVQESADKGDNRLITFDMQVRASVDGQRWGLKLSTVKANSDGSYGDKLVTDELDYGTYVLSLPELTDDGYYAVTEEQELKDALNSLRIGFAVIGEDEEGNETIERYLIYEPNADVHDSTMSGNHEELYRLSEEDGTAGTTVNEYYDASGNDNSLDADTDSESVFSAGTGRRQTLVPSYVAADDEDASTEAKTLGYELKNQVTVQQSKSSWNTELLAKTTDTITKWSPYVKEFGSFYSFVDSEGVNHNTDDSDYGYYLTLCNVTYAEPVTIRVFIWIEGQDLECWNQIMGGNILANFEFVAGDPYDFETGEKISCEVETQAEKASREAAESAESGAD